MFVSHALVILVLPAILPATDGSNILVFMPMPFKSHVGGFQPMFEELARRGHNVTVVSAYPLVNRSVANYTDIEVLPPKFMDFNVMQMLKHNIFTTLMSRWFMAKFLSNIMEQENIRNFIQSDSNSFDLVIVESFLQEYTVALGHKFNAPVINLSPAMIWVSISKWLHVPATYSYIPDCCIGSTDEMSFVERLKNTFTGFIEEHVENYVYIRTMKAAMNKHLTYKGWESRPPLEEMLNNVSLTLMNARHTIGVCRPYPPGVVEVGGMHIKEPKPLPKDLQSYIDSATDGVIFFSFGSFLNLSQLPEEKINIFIDVVGRLKQKIIIKWVSDGNIKLPLNVRTGSWLPQVDILAHPNVKLFITHGGFHSLEEAVYNAKPIVGIPFFADQHLNMKNAEKRGYGKLVNFMELTEESFGNAIEEVITNPTYKNNAIEQSIRYKDQPMKPLDRAIYWIEYVIRNDGAKHLIIDSVELNSAQYFLFDIILVLFLLAGLIIWLCYRGGIKLVTYKLKTN